MVDGGAIIGQGLSRVARLGVGIEERLGELGAEVRAEDEGIGGPAPAERKVGEERVPRPLAVEDAGVIQAQAHMAESQIRVTHDQLGAEPVVKTIGAVEAQRAMLADALRDTVAEVLIGAAKAERGTEKEVGAEGTIHAECESIVMEVG